MKFGPKIDLMNNDRKRKVWFMSDLHYNHFNILKINERHYGDIAEMNQKIIEEIKNKVSPNDFIFDLGDLIWKESPADIQTFSKVLPVRSYRVIGNHDGNNIEAWGKCWRGCYDLLDLIVKYEDEDIWITLSHYPILDWNHRYRGSWNLHGHCHGGIDSLNDKSGELRMDIGFDSEMAKRVGSFLIPFEEIWKEMKKRVGNVNFRTWAKERWTKTNLTI